MKKSKLKISIIVPVHNAARTLEACIQSIIAQKYENMECILVENGSIDNSIELCKKYSEIYSWIKFVICENIGISYARNLGLSLAQGEIIGFCDADDTLESNALRSVSNAFKDNPNIIAVIGAFYIGHVFENTIQKQYKGLSAKTISNADAVALTIGNDAVMGSVWNKYYRAKILNGIYFDTELSYCEDMHYNVKILSSLSQERKIALIDTPVYCYMMNESSVTHQINNLYDSEGNLKYIVALKKIQDECNLEKRSQVAVRSRIACLAIDHYSYANELQKKKLKTELIRNYSCLFNDMQFDVKRLIKSIFIIFNIDWSYIKRR